MKTLLFLTLVLVVLCSALAKQCPYTCAKRTCRKTGLFNWLRKCWIRTYTCYKECPVHGGWTPFRVTSQSACSVACGMGTRTVTKTRTCTNPVPRNGGRSCSGSTSITVSQTCRLQPCPVPGRWSSFTVTSRGPCSVTCGTGRRLVTKKRTCTNPRPMYGGRPCSGRSSIISFESCSAGSCPVHGGWTSWKVTTKGPCSVSCGMGTRPVTKTRTCTSPSPSSGGRPCSGPSSSTSSEICTAGSCPPVDGGWTLYRTVSRTNCSVTCGNGTLNVTQTRDCANPAPQHGGADCQGQNTRQLTQPCSQHPCPVDGGWTQYRTVSRTNCSVTCGNGTVNVTQTRDCANPAPQHGGADCQGQNTRQLTQPCSEHPCPAGPNCTEGGQVYHSAPDQRYFYQCFNGTAILQMCPEKTVWNNTITACEHEKMTTTTSSSSSSSSPFQTTTPSPNPAACAEGTRTAVPGKCANFYWCVNGRLIEMPCAPGSLFDVSNGRCDHAANVNCDG